jgi:hypothetical protein
MDTNDTRPSRGRTAGLVAAGLVGGVVLAGFASANAQTDPTPAPSQSRTAPGDKPPGDNAPGAPGDKGAKGHGPRDGRGRPGHGGPGMGIHGEFVAPAPGGGYQTIATQRGEVTAVSPTSLTVRSEDGFSRTYVVDDGTMVNAGNEGIADVKTGDQVHVVAVVTGGTAKAVDVRDGTQAGKLREGWAPRSGRPGAPGEGPAPGGAPAPSATASGSA